MDKLSTLSKEGETGTGNEPYEMQPITKLRRGATRKRAIRVQ